MRTQWMLPCAPALSWRLTSVCLRYAIGMPSVWFRKGICKVRRCSDFHSDYPLFVSSFSRQYCNVLKNLSMRRPFVVPWESLSSRGHRKSCLYPTGLAPLNSRPTGNPARNILTRVRLRRATGNQHRISFVASLKQCLTSKSLYEHEACSEVGDY